MADMMNTQSETEVEQLMYQAMAAQMQSEGMRAVCEVSSQPLEQPCPSGAVVYYADGGETLWDIAKRFKVSSDMLGGGEPDALLPKGERLIFIRK